MASCALVNRETAGDADTLFRNRLILTFNLSEFRILHQCPESYTSDIRPLGGGGGGGVGFLCRLYSMAIISLVQTT